jgi:aminocarboxymuconate-semialdehyde decarboxylase
VNDVWKIDVHTHILPPSWPDLRRRYGYGGFVQLEHTGPGCARMHIDGQQFRTIDAACWEPGERLHACDELGVRVQVLSTVPVMFSYWARPEHTHDLARLLNDHLASVVAAHPDRFVALGTLPMQAPDLAILELERCVDQLGFPGVQIGTNVNGRNLDDASLFPIFEAAQRLGACIFVHPWEMVGRERMEKYWLRWLVGMPAETALAICSLIFGGVFERLPNLRWCFAHGGGSFAATVGRIGRGFDSRPDLCAVATAIHPRAHLGKFMVDSLTHDEQALRLLLHVLGEDSVCLGSDYPFPLGEARPGQLIESMRDLSAKTQRKLLVENAMRFLGTKATSTPGISKGFAKPDRAARSPLRRHKK